MDVAVSVSGLKKTFRIGFLRRRVVAVKDSTFEVKRGEIFGLVGPNGAGKTTTIKMMMGLIAPDAGEGRIFGTSIREQEARRKVGFLPETPHFYDYLKPAELLRYFGALYGVPSDVVEERIPGLLELVGLAEATEKQLRKFSKGMHQRIGIAQALLPDSDLVILDEPQSGLDPMGRKDVRDIIIGLRDQGKTVLFSSHILPDVEQICDRVAIIVRGTVTRVGRLDELVDPASGSTDVVLRALEEGQALPDGLLDRAHERMPGGELRFRLDGQQAAEPILAQAMEAGLVISEVVRHRQDLEEIFLEEARKADEEARA